MGNFPHRRSELLQGAVLSGIALTHTAWKDHRAQTHRSVELSEPLDTALDVLGGPFTDTVRWAAVHRIHHSTPDANFVPAIGYADLIEWLDAHPDVKSQYEIPTMLQGLDPAIEAMTHEEVMEVGSLARELIKGRYELTNHYDDATIRRILYDQSPRYLYESPEGDKMAVPTIDGFEASLHDLRYLLRDPHAPALHPDGMKGIARYNRKLYDDGVDFFKKNPQYMPDDLTFTAREAWIEDHKKAVRLGMVAVNIAWRIAAERPKNGREFASAAMRGAAVAGLGTLGLIAGGNIVNSLGHGGREKFSSRQFIKDFWEGKVRVKENGTYTTDNTLLSPPTLGEVGGQYEHHEDPSLIAYTHETGWRKWAVDPFGAMTEYLATHNVGMKVGPGFDGPRPDMPSEAVLRLEEVRRRYIDQ